MVRSTASSSSCAQQGKEECDSQHCVFRGLFRQQHTNSHESSRSSPEFRQALVS
eukprot:m.58540 g.58540  ORF g.58540 m.58540 type:complete len:54 (+) comp7153_c0_seq2:1033-1194(+)